MSLPSLDCHLGILVFYEHELLVNEIHDIAIAMSSSRADPVLGLNILQYLLG